MGDVGRVGREDPTRSAASRGVPQLWAVAGGKGGTGRSFLAANLAHLMARDVGPVTLVDLDLEGANLHTFLGEPASRRGVGAFFGGAAPDLAGLVNHLAIPGLGFVPGPCASFRNVTREQVRRLISAVHRLETPWVVCDLPAMPSRALVALFLAAARPVIVIEPEPAAVEGAHRFIKQVYAEVLRQRLREARVPAAEQEGILHAAAWLSPERLIERLDTLRPGLGDRTHHALEATTLYLVVNKVRHRSDEAAGLSFKNAVQSYFGMTVCHVGAVPYDDDVWWSARRRRLYTRDEQGETLAMHLEKVVAGLVEGTELAPPRHALPRMQLL